MTNESPVVQRWQRIRQSIGEVQLIAVSKYTTDENIGMLAQAGQVDFGESKPQNLRDRAQKFPHLRWHMIGALQKNKAKYIGRLAHTWHSCCDIETAQAVAKHVAGRRLPVFVQVNISGEAQKQGIHPDEVPLFFRQLNLIDALKPIGLMGMAAKDGNPQVAFSLLRKCRDKLQKQCQMSLGLCMGMSNDWRIAIAEGATVIRVGSEIFGQD